MTTQTARSIQEPARTTPVIADYDVLVVGGGPAGLTSALAAAEDGLRVGLIESRSFVGGNMTIGLPVLGFLGQKGNQIIEGLPQKFIDRLQGAQWRERASAMPAAHGHHARRAGSGQDGSARNADRSRRRRAVLYLLCRRGDGGRQNPRRDRRKQERPRRDSRQGRHRLHRRRGRGLSRGRALREGQRERRHAAADAHVLPGGRRYREAADEHCRPAEGCTHLPDGFHSGGVFRAEPSIHRRRPARTHRQGAD